MVYGDPFLPLGAMATAATLAGCNDSDNDSSIVTRQSQLTLRMQRSLQCQLLQR